jgi:hypothetical protein
MFYSGGKKSGGFWICVILFPWQLPCLLSQREERERKWIDYQVSQLDKPFSDLYVVVSSNEFSSTEQ